MTFEFSVLYEETKKKNVSVITHVIIHYIQGLYVVGDKYISNKGYEKLF